MTAFFDGKFPAEYDHIRDRLVDYGERVQADQWQSTARVDPMKQVIEMPFSLIRYAMPPLMMTAALELQCNLPWAEEHFLERVSGEPLNPPPSHVNWPFAQGGNEKFLPNGRFSHSYPERLWLGNFGYMVNPTDRPVGSEKPWRNHLADLRDLVHLIRQHPTTRQAFIPIWWPTDGKVAESQRVPCTIGYHFLLRDHMLHCHYFMRSCDAMRHLPDDLYMATRLTQWICDQLNKVDDWEYTEPGILEMNITSLHIFEGDVQVIKFQRSQR